jgi:hypothetical protein
LLRTYCALVSLELGLKDFLGLTESPGNGGHDLPDLLNQVKQHDQRLAGPINSIQTQLRNRLSSVRCQGKAGTAHSIPARSYPYLRYVRHEQDWDADYSTEGQLQDVHNIVQKLFSTLKHHGVDL